ncbi:MAG: hypothetical protein HYZ75_12480 [Elusimicrobia bacterium]|nr:hypothetical protein [Elusimicrobiota bacterium]
MAQGGASEPATKADVQLVRAELGAVRNELKAEIGSVKVTVDKLVVEMVKTQADLRDIRQTMATKDDIGRVLAAIDAFAGKAVAYDQKSYSHGAILTDHEDKLRDHGRRLSSLEAKP